MQTTGSIMNNYWVKERALQQIHCQLFSNNSDSSINLKLLTDREAASAAGSSGRFCEWVQDPFQASWVASPLTSIGAAAADG